MLAVGMKVTVLPLRLGSMRSSLWLTSPNVDANISLPMAPPFAVPSSLLIHNSVICLTGSYGRRLSLQNSGCVALGGMGGRCVMFAATFS